MSAPRVACIDTQCVPIPPAHQPEAASYNTVEDRYLCYSPRRHCEVVEGGRKVSVKTDAQTDADSARLLLKMTEWGPTMGDLTRRYVTKLQLPEGYHYSQVCLDPSLCPRPADIEFQKEWARRMARYYGVRSVEAPFPRRVDLVSVFGGLLTYGSHRGSGSGSAIVAYHGRPFAGASGDRDAGSETDYNTEIHELTHAYSYFKLGEGRLPGWLDHLLAYYVADDGKVPRSIWSDAFGYTYGQFMNDLRSAPLEVIMGTAGTSGSALPKNLRGDIGELCLTALLGEALLQLNPRAIEILGRELLRTDFSRMPSDERPKVWLKILEQKAGISEGQFRGKVWEKIGPDREKGAKFVEAVAHYVEEHGEVEERVIELRTGRPARNAIFYKPVVVPIGESQDTALRVEVRLVRSVDDPRDRSLFIGGYLPHVTPVALYRDDFLKEYIGELEAGEMLPIFSIEDPNGNGVPDVEEDWETYQYRIECEPSRFTPCRLFKKRTPLVDRRPIAGWQERILEALKGPREGSPPPDAGALDPDSDDVGDREGAAE